MLGSDKWIRQQCVHPSRLQVKDFNGMCPHEMHTSLVKGHENITPMITPFHPQLVREVNNAKVLSFGTSSFGYDIQLKPEWKTPKPGIRLDPKKDNEHAFTTVKSDTYLIEPNGFVLAHTVERFNMPPNVLGICLGKSTYARLGLVVNVTPLEPDWKGHLVVEISNTTKNPVVIYANEGIAQILFIRNEDCETTYGDRAGKYQDQDGIVLPRI